MAIDELKSADDVPRTAWWEWPQVLSLEAPAVAMLWLLGVANLHGIRLMPEVVRGLGLVVWGIYLVDRTLDARKMVKTGGWTARHAFCARYRRVIWGGVLPVWVMLVGWLGWFRIPQGLFWHCVSIGVLVGGYLIWYVLWGRVVKLGAAVVPKEVLAAALFAVGVMAGAHSDGLGQPLGALWMEQALLTGLFGLNLLGIAVAEGEESGKQRWYGGWLAVLVAGVVGVWLPWVTTPDAVRELALAVGAGALLLWLLHRYRRRFSPAAYRSLADGCLVLPVVWLW